GGASPSGPASRVVSTGAVYPIARRPENGAKSEHPRPTTGHAAPHNRHVRTGSRSPRGRLAPIHVLSFTPFLRRTAMRARSIAIAAAGIWATTATASAQPGYYQFPDIHDHTIVFSAEGDLWLVADSGGTARRITTHPGTEYFPRFSPDGKW